MGRTSATKMIRAAKTGIAVALLAVAGGTATGNTDPARPWNEFLGSWQGDGSAQVAAGTNEKIRCRVSYQVTGAASQVSQSIRCATTSDQIQVSATLRSVGGRVSGTWHDQRKGTDGSVTGTLADNDLDVVMFGGGQSASVSISVADCRQTIRMQSQSTEIRSLSLVLAKQC